MSNDGPAVLTSEMASDLIIDLMSVWPEGQGTPAIRAIAALASGKTECRVVGAAGAGVEEMDSLRARLATFNEAAAVANHRREAPGQTDHSQANYMRMSLEQEWEEILDLANKLAQAAPPLEQHLSVGGVQQPSQPISRASRSGEVALTIERRIELLREWLPDLCDDERLVVFERVADGYCRECGSKFLPCYCTRGD
jgi:hypothetical protein